jgi:ZIP family zinc transporter
MLEAFLWRLFGAAFLLLGAWLAYRFDLSRRVIAVVMHPVGRPRGHVLLLVAVVFAAGDRYIHHRGGAERKVPTGTQTTGSPLATVLGSILLTPR